METRGDGNSQSLRRILETRERALGTQAIIPELNKRLAILASLASLAESVQNLVHFRQEL